MKKNVSAISILRGFSDIFIDEICVNGFVVPRFTGEFWTAKQRDASSIHEISYRACFKPQLPRFFIQAFTSPGDRVYDPFSGRGTTVIEAGLNDRKPTANDINPLSTVLSRPRFFIPEIDDVCHRIESIKGFRETTETSPDLSMFYHEKTLQELLRLRSYLLFRQHNGTLDHIDEWIRMVATNRLTGHSSGFFSVYTLPPNQAVSRARQKKINRNLGQEPSYRDIYAIIVKKTKELIKKTTAIEKQTLLKAGSCAVFFNDDARNTEGIADNSIHLTVTSPPFLSVVQYASDNWLRCWFNGINEIEISRSITVVRKISDWSTIMQDVFHELYRITVLGGRVAFEVGDVEKGTVHLDEYVIPLGVNAGFHCEGVFVNNQSFTKTANIWGVSNNSKGTNSNRIVLFLK